MHRLQIDHVIHCIFGNIVSFEQTAGTYMVNLPAEITGLIAIFNAGNPCATRILAELGRILSFYDTTFLPNHFNNLFVKLLHTVKFLMD